MKTNVNRQLCFFLKLCTQFLQESICNFKFSTLSFFWLVTVNSKKNYSVNANKAKDRYCYDVICKKSCKTINASLQKRYDTETQIADSTL